MSSASVSDLNSIYEKVGISELCKFTDIILSGRVRDGNNLPNEEIICQIITEREYLIERGWGYQGIATEVRYTSTRKLSKKRHGEGFLELVLILTINPLPDLKIVNDVAHKRKQRLEKEKLEREHAKKRQLYLLGRASTLMESSDLKIQYQNLILALREIGSSVLSGMGVTESYGKFTDVDFISESDEDHDSTDYPSWYLEIIFFRPRITNENEHPDQSHRISNKLRELTSDFVDFVDSIDEMNEIIQVMKTEIGESKKEDTKREMNKEIWWNMAVFVRTVELVLENKLLEKIIQWANYKKGQLPVHAVGKRYPHLGICPGCGRRWEVFDPKTKIYYGNEECWYCGWTHT